MTAALNSVNRSSYQPFASFSLIWAGATLIHQLAFTFWAESWSGWLLVFAAVFVIHHPSCVFRFTILVITGLIHLWSKLPFVPNHILYEGMLHLIMLLALGSYFLSGPGRTELTNTWGEWKKRLPLLLIAIAVKTVYFFLPSALLGPLLGGLSTLFLIIAFGWFLATPVELGQGEFFFDRAAPLLRVAVLVMYFWAGTQKLNWDYFDPNVSCAALLHKGIAAYYGGLISTAPWTLNSVATISLIFEFGIPILLFIRRTRYLGYFAALVFHLWLSQYKAAGVFGFSDLILGVLILFLPMEWGHRLRSFWDVQLRWLGGGDLDVGRKRAHYFVIGVFFVALISQGTLYLTKGRNYEVFWTANWIAFGVFITWGLWLGFSFLYAGWRDKFGNDSFANHALPTWAWLGIIPVLLNGLWPWIGGRTQTSFSMYSNLRSEGVGNHMFLRRVDLFQLQNDMVHVLTSSPDILAPSEKPTDIAQYANLGFTYLPWFEFRRLISEHKGDFEVTYERGGKTQSLGRKDGKDFGDSEAFVRLPFLQRKFVWFRRLQSLDEPMICTH